MARGGTRSTGRPRALPASRTQSHQRRFSTCFFAYPLPKVSKCALQDGRPGGERQDYRRNVISSAGGPAAPLAARDSSLARNGAEIVAVIPGRLGGFAHAFFGNGFARQCSAVFTFHCYPAV